MTNYSIYTKMVMLPVVKRGDLELATYSKIYANSYKDCD